MFCLVYIQENKTDHAMGLDWQNPVLEGNANTEASVTDMPVQSFQPLLKFSYYTVKCAIFLFCDVTWSFFLASYLQTITPNTCSCSYFHFWKSGLLHCFLKIQTRSKKWPAQVSEVVAGSMTIPGGGSAGRQAAGHVPGDVRQRCAAPSPFAGRRRSARRLQGPAAAGTRRGASSRRWPWRNPLIGTCSHPSFLPMHTSLALVHLNTLLSPLPWRILALFLPECE